MLCESIRCSESAYEITEEVRKNAALLFSVRDMRNQVFRIEGVSVADRDQISLVPSPSLHYPLSFPLSERVLDFIRSAMLFLGCVCDALVFTAGWCRAISPDLVEFAVWRLA